MQTNARTAPLRVSGNLRSRLRRLWINIKKYKHVYVILAPVLLYYLIFCYIPMGGNIIAFKNYSVAKGILGSPWVGIKHFEDFLSSYTFWRLLRNTVMINLYGLVIGFPAPIILALLLNELRGNRFKRVVQTITYMPYFISTVVIVGIMLDFLATNGVINQVLGVFGKEPVQFMARPDLFWMVYTVSEVWQGVGWGSIIYLSALSGIDEALYEAAAIDGAGRWRRLWHITLPGIMGTIMIMLILRIGQMLSLGFEKIMLLYNPSIYETADVISTYVYRKGILELSYSFSTAVGLFNSVINFVLLITANQLSKRFTQTGLW